MMQYRPLGDSGFALSEVGFGTWDLGRRVIEETDAATLMLTFDCLNQAAAEQVLPLAF